MIAADKDVAGAMEEEGIDVLIATSRRNVFYTSGFWATSTVTAGPENYERTGMYHDWEPPKALSVWSVDEGGPKVVLPPWIAIKVEDEANDIDVPHEDINIYDFSATLKVPFEDRLSDNDRRAIELLENQGQFSTREEALMDILEPLVDSSTTVGIETDNPTSYVLQSVEKNLNPGEIVDGLPLFYKLRLTKTDEEIRRLRKAAEINDEAITEAMEALRPGMTEHEFKVIYKTKIYEKGGIEQMPFEHSMIGFGPHSAYQHTRPGDREIQDGDIIRTEVGCRYEHYPSDLSRAFMFGSGDERLEKKYDILYSGMEKCRELIADGLNTADVYNQTVDHVQTIAAEQGDDDLAAFDMSMIGHNIGLDIHDPPLVSARDNELLPGMVINYELYNQEIGVGNIHLEDTLLITEDGVEDFTRCEETLPVYS